MSYKKTIWILNHHATEMAFQHGGRHYYFAKYLIEKGYSVRIFCASVFHGSQKDAIDLARSLSKEQIVDGIPFVFVKTRKYQGNGIARVMSMFDYYFNVKKACKQYSQPDVVIGSSVHPLACVAAIHLSRRYGCKNIAEIRDLWPESIVQYGLFSSRNPLVKILYQVEKWIYMRANAIIFTMEGGSDYITERKWDFNHRGPINLNNIYHINNGIDLQEFDYNKSLFLFQDNDLDNPNTYKIVYTGSLRQANKQIWTLFEAIKLMNKKEFDDYKFFIYGSGEELIKLKTFCFENSIKNVFFKGKIEKHYIPYVLSKCNLNILNISPSNILKFGGSQNKLFEYLASGHPILSGEDSEYSIVKNRGCGIARHYEKPEDVVQAILELRLKSFSSEHIRSVAKEYDFSILTNKLISIIGSITNES